VVTEVGEGFTVAISANRLVKISWHKKKANASIQRVCLAKGLNFIHSFEVLSVALI
jgi:hypothetical protein